MYQQKYKGDKTVWRWGWRHDAAALLQACVGEERLDEVEEKLLKPSVSVDVKLKGSAAWELYGYLSASHRGQAAGCDTGTSLSSAPPTVWLIQLVIKADRRVVTSFIVRLSKCTLCPEPKDNGYICISGSLACLLVSLCFYPEHPETKQQLFKLCCS